MSTLFLPVENLDSLVMNSSIVDDTKGDFTFTFVDKMDTAMKSMFLDELQDDSEQNDYNASSNHSVIDERLNFKINLMNGRNQTQINLENLSINHLLSGAVNQLKPNIVYFCRPDNDKMWKTDNIRYINARR